MTVVGPAYDSRPDTLAHIAAVAALLAQVRDDLKHRATVHDASKLCEPEKSFFDEFTPKLRGTTYESDEYKSFLVAMKPALDHHYAHNRHHPEHFGYLECNGCFKRFPKDHDGCCDVCGYGQFQFRPDILAMNLVDLIEMLCDWKAATGRHADGDIRKSIEINQKRFGYSYELKRFLLNTVEAFGW
jgi:hypothetical protein